MPLTWFGGCASLSIDPSNVPIELGADAFRTVVQTAAAEWSAADCGSGSGPSFRFVPYPDCPHGAEWLASGPNSNTVSFRTRWGDDAYHVAGAIAITITTFHASTGELRDADTELNLRAQGNADGFDFTTGVPSPSATIVYLPAVLTHELGHAQGLAHSTVPSAIMWFQAAVGTEQSALDNDDIMGICNVYPSMRATSCDPRPVGGFTCGSPGCGCRIRELPTGPGALEWVVLSGSILAIRLLRTRRSNRDNGANPTEPR